MLLSCKLNISLDAHMSVEIKHDAGVKDESRSGLIVITSLYENVITTCYKVAASSKMHGGKNSPQYILFGVDRDGSNFWDNRLRF